MIEPIRLRAEVIHGFGRGSTQLGFPTANLQIRWDAEAANLTEEESNVLRFAQAAETGVYCAFAHVEGIVGVHKVAMSMGWNPTFTDVKTKTIEPWLLHKFDRDFYGAQIRLIVCGFVRPEAKFGSLDELIREIEADGEYCTQALQSEALRHYRDDLFLSGASTQKVQSSCLMSANLSEASAILAPRAVDGTCTRLLLVRHGESTDNVEGKLSGAQSAAPLTAHGWNQAAALAHELASLSPALKLDVVGSSRLARACNTADAVGAQFPGAERLVVDGIEEMDYGRLEGMMISDAKQQMSEISQSWNQGDLTVSVGGGESPKEALERVLRALGEVLRKHQGSTVLLVGHSMVIKALVAAVRPGSGLKSLLSVPQRNCALNVFRFDCEHRGSSPVGAFELIAADLVADCADARL